MSRFAGGILDHPWYVVGALGAVALTFWVIGTRTQSHYVTASFSSAFNLYPGLDVQIDGRDVGKLGKVKYQDDGTATVRLGIDKEEYWPLHQGTRAVMRYGTTIGNGTRKIDVIPGPSSNPELPEDGIVGMQFTKPVVDVDQVVNVFTRKKRNETRALTSKLDESIEGPQLNNALRTAGPGVEAASTFLRDLGADNMALKGLILNTRRAMGNLASRSENLSDLITVTAGTFDEFAQNTNGIESALAEGPGAFREARTTLQRLDRSVDGLDDLVTDLRPGARELKPLAAAATPALRQLSATVPSGVDTVQAVRRASPPLQRLLTVGTPFVTRLGENSEPLAPMVACIRPYAPEGAGTITGLAGWTQAYETVGNDVELSKLRDLPLRYDQRKASANTFVVHGLRANPNLSARSLDAYPPELSTKAFTQLTGTTYAFPRPPGLTTGQPWFQPECGVGPESLDPAQDPED